MEHDLYGAFDKDAPEAIKDGNGEVVLALCRICGMAEAQLDEYSECPGVDQEREARND